MFKKVGLTRDEKRVIKRITRVQIGNLENLLNNDCEMDLKLIFLMEEINEEEFRDHLIMGLDIYKSVRECPRKLFNLGPDYMSIVKHLMVNFARHPKYEQGKKGLWRKFNIIEFLPLGSN